MNFKKYKYIDETLSNKKMINNITSLKLLKANELFQMENYKSSKIIIDQILDELLLNETKLSPIVLNTLIKLSVLLGNFRKILKIINKNNLKILDLKEDFFYIEVISNYFKFLRKNNKYPSNYLNEKANNSTKKGFLYYILFLTCKNEDYSKDFLKISLHEEPLNLSAIYELIDLGEEINSKSLKFALEVENDLFNKLNYKKKKRKLWNIKT
ncbi:hypothetical protein Z969_10655 [Clostridium novyi A str. 4570]|uniref:Uncharacterized protein n=1 Tax=Clostridium novyi A str. 4570 TaxID=1444290 RepID=A0AA88ZQF1_CLONO|nr:hypothetical protein [Clostridium novyi]KGM99481.1 hypothetical protein Z969_10655 [Clostridium novyi A str. 4570]